MAINNFIEYFEDLCIRHKAILHKPGVETHFVTSNDEKDVSIDSQLYYPCVLLERGEFKYDGQESAMTKNTSFYLMILDHVEDKGEFVEIQNALNTCEKILDELMNKIIEDRRNRKYNFLLGFSLPGTEAEPIQNVDDSLYGWEATFTLNKSYSAKNCEDVFLPEE